MRETRSIGFIGLGVMGEPICANLAAKSGLPVFGHDIDPEPLERLAASGVEACASVAEVVAGTDVVFLSLPGGPEVEAVVDGPDGILARARPGQTIVDTSTSPVTLTRDLAARLGAAGVRFADAPVARTRAAAWQGTLSIMVGGDPETFARIEPLLACAASEITHCGPVGAGQVVKLMNNMILFETVVALSEALAIGRRAGVDGGLLFETLSRGSADSFALRNHGMKALLPGEFPEQAFSTRYARKDLAYALELAAEHGVTARAAELAAEILEESERSGRGDRYFPALLEVIDPGS